MGEGRAGLPRRPPAPPIAVLEVIEEAASRTLADLRALVGALRDGDEAELAPQRGVPDIERLSPLGTEHITLTGRYRIALPEALRDRSSYRELNTTPAVAA